MTGWPGRLMGMNQQPASVLAHPIEMQCLDQHGAELSFDVQFEYDPRDPYAVWVCFPRGIRWAVCRSLLSRGLIEECGDGDLHLSPGVDATGRSIVEFEFRSPDGRLSTRAATGQLFRFVTRTLALVPAGTETVDVDALIADLLAAE